MASSTFQRVGAYAGILAALTGLYFCAGKVGLSLAFLNASASAVWPPAGLALAALLLLGQRVWPAIFLGAFLVNFTTTGFITSSLGIAAGNSLEAIVGAALIGRFAGGPRVFDQAGSIFRFVLIASIPSTGISAVIGVTTLVLSGLASVENARSVLLTWWLGDLLSHLVLTPLLVIWLARPLPRLSRSRLLEALALAGLFLVISQLIFGPLHLLPERNLPVAYLAMPVLIWAAFRFHQHGASISAFLLSTTALLGTIDGTGPFAVADRNTSLLLMQGFMGVMTLASLLLAALSAERFAVEASLRESEAREHAARGEAERASQAKDRFLAVLSHELRTPLTPILLIASALEKEQALPDHLREDLGTIRRNAELEARLIDDLLDLNRITHGKMKLSLEVTDIHPLIRSAVGISCSRDGSLPVELQLAASHHHVLGDPARLQQVLWNLLNNAQNYTPAAGGRITVRSRNEARPEGTAVVIEICDNGAGIEPELLPRLFQAFEQGEAAAHGKTGGLGLGLAITRALVSANGGKLRAQSDGRGRGSMFAVEFPAVAPPAPVQVIAPPHSHSPAGKAESLQATGP